MSAQKWLSGHSAKAVKGHVKQPGKTWGKKKKTLKGTSKIVCSCFFCLHWSHTEQRGLDALRRTQTIIWQSTYLIWPCAWDCTVQFDVHLYSTARCVCVVIIWHLITEPLLKRSLPNTLIPVPLGSTFCSSSTVVLCARAVKVTSVAHWSLRWISKGTVQWCAAEDKYSIEYEVRFLAEI